MTQLTTTSDTYRVSTTGGMREDLEDVIHDLFPEDTWALTNLDKVDAMSTNHEWLRDTLQGATANAQIEGDDPTFTDVDPPVRHGTYMQISRKTFLISRTLEKVAKAGRKSEVARTAMKRMRELKRDMELALVGNQASTAGGEGTARTTAGMETWIGGTAGSSTTVTNVMLATSTASATTPATTSGAAGTAPTDGTTTGALAEVILTRALEAAWTDGGDPRVILVGSTQKRAIDAFTGIATRQVDVGRAQEASIIGAANLYVSDFGRHQVILHRYMRSSVVLCIDPDYWAVAYLDRPFVETLAKTGDGEKRQIITEFGLVSRNWQANAKVVACA